MQIQIQNRADLPPIWEIGTMQLQELRRNTPVAPRHKYTERRDAIDLIRECLTHEPSDIHINVGHPIILEVEGRMMRITDHELDWSEFENFARVIRDKEGATTTLAQREDWDGAFILNDATGTRRRLRVNMTALNSIRQNQSASLVMRPLQDMPPTVAQVGLSPDLVARCYPKEGAVYVVGPTGSGKTSTFGALIRHAAESGAHYHGHWRAYESPPEFDLEGLSSKHLMITQVAVHVPWGLDNFAAAVRNAMRSHPVAILIGEVRDYETISAVVEASLTGHPVFGTVHASNPGVAFQRLITRYPAEQAKSALYDLVSTTQVILAQRLIKRLDGKRAAIREWICFDEDVRRRLLTLNGPGEINSAITQMIETHGQSFAQSVRNLLNDGIIDEVTAMEHGVH